MINPTGDRIHLTSFSTSNPEMIKTYTPPALSHTKIEARPLNGTPIQNQSSPEQERYKSAAGAFLAKHPAPYQSYAFNALKIVRDWPATRPLSNEDKAAINHTAEMMETLARGNYTTEEAWDYISWSVNLTAVQLNGRSVELETKTDAFAKNIKDPSSYTFKRWEESEGHSAAYLMYPKDSNEPYALLKESKPEFTSSFDRLIPEFRGNSSCWEQELIGFEMDQVLGLNHTPATLAVTLNHEGETVRGTLQEFVKGARPAGSSTYFDPEGARLIRSLPKSNAHLVAVSGMIKGLAASHMNNYIFHYTKDESGKEVIDEILEIDQAELMLPYNRLNGKVKILRVEELKKELEIATKPEEKQAIQKKIDTVYRSIILCRLWILGMPQSDIPVDKVVFKGMLHPSLLPILKKYHAEVMQKYYHTTPEAMAAQVARVEQMQGMAARVLEGEGVMSTRDIYFEIFGGRHLYELAKERRFPMLIAFNNGVSDPYQNAIKDFADPEKSMIHCVRLDKPRDETPESQHLLKNLRDLEGLST